MSPYRTVNYLGYRVSVSTSAACNYAREAGSLARGASRLEIRSGPDHYELLVLEIQAQAVRAEAAAVRARAALDRCWAMARKDPRGPVIRVSDRSNLLFPEDASTSATVAECFKQVQSGRAEAHVALDIVKGLCALVAAFGHGPDASHARTSEFGLFGATGTPTRSVALILRERALPVEVKVDADAEASPSACPFCGVEATDWDIELCEHLLADFGDGSDGDRGILCGSGGSRCGNAALDCLNNLESAVADLAAAQGLNEWDVPNSEEQLALRRSLYGDGKAPAWWQPLVDGLSGGLDRVALFRTVEAIWDTMAPWSEDLVSTTAILGGPMTASNVTFIWARHPQEAAKTITSTVGAIESEIRAASALLLKQG